MTVRISDTSPLVFLAKLDRIELLRLGVDRVLVPSAVAAEVRAKPDAAAASFERALGTWLDECPSVDQRFLRLLPDLGAGERELVAQALQEEIISVALDDLDARRVAQRCGLRPIGTVGLLLAARKRNLIQCLRDELSKLESLGFRIADDLVEKVLSEAGESPSVR